MTSTNRILFMTLALIILLSITSVVSANTIVSNNTLTAYAVSDQGGAKVPRSINDRNYATYLQTQISNCQNGWAALQSATSITVDQYMFDSSFGAAYAIANFTFQASSDASNGTNGNWTVLENITGNTNQTYNRSISNGVAYTWYKLVWTGAGTCGGDGMAIKEFQLYNTTTAAPAPTISFQGQTPANSTNNYWLDTFQINTTAINFGGATNTTHYLFNGSGSLKSQINGTGQTTLLSNFTSFTPGIYYYNATATNYTNTSSTETRQINLTYWNAYLNITIKNALNGTVLGNASINVTDLNSSWLQTYNTTTGQVLAYIAKNNTQNIYVDAPGYSFQSQNYTANSTSTQYVNVSLYTNNSISINIYDEQTGFPILQNITITSTGLVEYINYSATGTFYIDGLTDGTWTIKFQGSNYSLKQYIVTVGSRSHQTLDAFLTTSTSNVIFTIVNSQTQEVIENAAFLMERLINGSWTTINSKDSDITGKVQVTYLPSVKYKFTVSKTGYSSLIFYLDPVIFSAYQIPLDPLQTFTTTHDYFDVSIVYYPTFFVNNNQTNFTYVINSPTGELINYTVTLFYPGGNASFTGTNANGESELMSINITNATLYSKVNMTYTYTSTNEGYKRYTRFFEITNTTGTSSRSIINIRNKDYGLGLFEKALISTFATIIIAGFMFSLAGLAGAMVAAMFGFGLAAFLGFLPWSATFISFIVGFVLILAANKGPNGG